jgi:hypothetical protein
VDLHGRDASPGEKGEEVGDAIVPFPREQIRDEEVRGRKRSDRGGEEERNTPRDTPPEEEKGKEIRGCG